MRPDSLVELGVDADVRGAHQLEGGSLDSLDGRGSALLELAAMDKLVQVNSRFTGNDLGDGGTLFGFNHCLGWMDERIGVGRLTIEAVACCPGLVGSRDRWVAKCIR